MYLADCSSHYTARTLKLTQIYCSEGLLFLDDMGVHTIADITYDTVIKLIGAKMYCSDDTKAMILNNTARMIRFYSDPSSMDHYTFADVKHLRECALSIKKFPVRKEVFDI